MNRTLTQSQLTERFDYKDGQLYWKNGKRPGQPVGCLDKQGYRVTALNGKYCKHTNLVWMLHNGPIPDGMQIDHINRDRADDRVENLRLASSKENCANRVFDNNTSGLKGVKWYPNRTKGWKAKYRDTYLGMYSTSDEAALAFNIAAFADTGIFAHLNEVVIG